ncbi:unnamed protein product, partial [Musa acuminata subsp. burmannicoides]
GACRSSVCKSSAVLPLLWRRRFLPRCLQLPHRSPHRDACHCIAMRITLTQLTNEGAKGSITTKMH